MRAEIDYTQFSLTRNEMWINHLALTLVLYQEKFALTVSTLIAFFLLSLEFGSFKLINISAVVDMTS